MRSRREASTAMVGLAALATATGEGATMGSPQERNRRTVIAFYDLMFNQCKPAEAVDQYVGAVYIQHTPGVADGEAAFIEYFRRMAKDYPGKTVEFKHIFAEGDFVVLHGLQHWPGDHDWAGMDIFRLDADGKVVEHWDVLQIAPDKAANPNGMF
jgi:predicted SnoaL-like aldol condensation-catalyzing enzyme